MKPTGPELFAWLLGLLDPFFTIEPRTRNRLVQWEWRTVRFAALFNALIWPVLYVLHFHINDRLKTPIELYFRYRYGSAALILISGLLVYAFRVRTAGMKLWLTALAAYLCIVQSWSMTLGPYISHSYLIWLPLIVFASFARSFLVSAPILLALVLIAKVFWAGHTEPRFIFSDTAIGLFVLFGTNVVRRVWIRAKEQGFLNDDLRREAFESRQMFDKQIRSFISPTLMKSIDNLIAGGSSFIAAIDSVLKLRRATITALYSDIRNFSERSNSIKFIEDELIPSSRNIIDSAEENRGIAKQIGDAVFIFYCEADSEESLLRGLKDGFYGSLCEKRRVQSLKRESMERFFSISHGEAFIGNMSSTRHREATTIGPPANIAARIDALTKERVFQELIGNQPGVLMDDGSWNVVRGFANEWQVNDLNLPDYGLEVRSYPDIQRVHFLAANKTNIDILNQLLRLNKINEVQFTEVIDGY